MVVVVVAVVNYRLTYYLPTIPARTPTPIPLLVRLTPYSLPPAPCSPLPTPYSLLPTPVYYSLLLLLLLLLLLCYYDRGLNQDVRSRADREQDGFIFAQLRALPSREVAQKKSLHWAKKSYGVVALSSSSKSR